MSDLDYSTPANLPSYSSHYKWRIHNLIQKMSILVEYPEKKRVRFNPRVEMKEYVIEPNDYAGTTALGHRGSRLTSSHNKSVVCKSYKLSNQLHTIYHSKEIQASFSESSDIDMALCVGPLNKPNKNKGMSCILEEKCTLPFY